MVRYRLGEAAGHARIEPLAAPSSKAEVAAAEKGLFRRLLVWFGDRQAKRRAVAQLGALDDRLLNDMGVLRADIAARVYGAGGRSTRAKSERIADV